MRCGAVAKLSISSPYRRGGLGRRALRYLISTYPGVEWRTSGQYPWARGFWSVMSEETNAGWREHGTRCEHIRHS